MSKKKDCMFQYSVERNPGNFSTYDIIEDTGLITHEEAKELFEKYLPDFTRELEDGINNPEIGIWINCKSEIDYHTCEPHLDKNTKHDSRGFYTESKKYIEF